MSFFGRSRNRDERLLWSRDERFVGQLAQVLHGTRVLPLHVGACLIGPLEAMGEARISQLAGEIRYGLVRVDGTAAETDRYLLAMTEAVQQSGIADRVGMSQSPTAVHNKILDTFFALRMDEFVFQPIVQLATLEAVGYEALCRPKAASMNEIVEAAVVTRRSVQLDRYLIERALRRIARLEPMQTTINVLPASLLDPALEAATLARQVRDAGVPPATITFEVTEQQAIDDVKPLKSAAKALRKEGFGFAVDDAGAGHASFTMIAALRPTVIKIDREIVFGIHRDDAKQALVEAFVSFSRRIEARLVAEGIAQRKDLAALIDHGVELGQGYLLGRPHPQPRRPRQVRLTLAPRLPRVRIHPRDVTLIG